ncbi:MAG: Xylanase [Pedosphaera sp.]|nr:Xylanase [Pedosphaera sp.]
MKFTTFCQPVLFCGIFLAAQAGAAEPSQPALLWPNGAPGETNTVSTEHDTSEPGKGLVAGKPVIRLGNVSQPTITIYRPAAAEQTGTAVIVCPGGGYSILAYDLEGTEVCDWLNSKGVTAVLLKYRVPAKNSMAPLQDAQRALGLLRHRAQEFGVDAHRIGILGFSAGGNLSARLSANCAQRAYPEADAADKESCRPDFQLLIYPAYLASAKDPTQLVPDVAVGTNTAPTFIVMAEDDPVKVENALAYASALKLAKLPVELHVYPTGGHGYGLRRTKEPITMWPDRAAEWMEHRDLLKRQ